MRLRLFDQGSDMRLEGRIVELQVLSDDDYKDLAETCLDPEIWRDTIAKITSEAELRDYLDRGLRQYAAGEAMPFVIRLRRIVAQSVRQG